MSSPNARPGPRKVIILLTDGQYTEANPVPPGTRQRPPRMESLVHTITFGDFANQTDMQAISDAANGVHMHAADATTLTNAFKKLSAVMAILPNSPRNVTKNDCLTQNVESRHNVRDQWNTHRHATARHATIEFAIIGSILFAFVFAGSNFLERTLSGTQWRMRHLKERERESCPGAAPVTASQRLNNTSTTSAFRHRR